MIKGADMLGSGTFQLNQADAVEWLRSLPSDSADLLITDPPYESLEKHRAIGTTTRLKVSAASSNPWFQVFPNARFEELFVEVHRVLRRHTHFYLLCDSETAFIAKPIAEAVGFKFWKPLVWDKCIAPDTPVWTTTGVRRASEIRPGDRVATPDGRDVAVLAARSTRSPALRLALSDGTSLVCSVDHRLLSAGGEEREARLLTPGMALAEAPIGLQPKARTLPLDELVDEDERVLARRLQNDATLWFPESVPLDYGLGKLIGLYAAEGSRTDVAVSFALHEDEKHLQNHVARVARSLGLRTTSAAQDGHGCVVTVSSKFFSMLIGAFVGGKDAASKYLTPRALQADREFMRGIFDGLIEGDGHWSNEEQRETYVSASLDLACFVQRFARGLGFHTTMRRFENDRRGGWKVRFDPAPRAEPLTVVSIETAGDLDLVDIAIDDPAQLYVLGNGAVSHNCSIGMGYHYRARYEFVLFFEKGKRRLNNLGAADVIEAPRVRGGYPAEKPVQLLETLIRQSSAEGDLVVDPFMGSGSAGVAALKLGRRFLGNDVADESLLLARRRLLELAGEEGSLLAPEQSLALPFALASTR